MTTETRRFWIHERGDQYEPVLCQVVGNTDIGFEFEYSSAGDRFPVLSRARRLGLKVRGSDDFNIAVIRKGSLVALLWMNEIVDDEPEVLAEISEKLGWAS